MEDIDNFMSLLEKSKTSYNAASAAEEMLLGAGFRELSMSDDWCIYSDKGYFTRVFGSTVIAFKTGSSFGYQDIVKIAAAHTDHPCLAIKTGPVIKSGKYRRINVEVYGGAILNTWFDRPLGIAGRVALRGSDVMNPELRIIDIDRPVMFIPNLAIHMNRDVNKGIELNRQNDMAPVISMIEDELSCEDYLLSLVANHIKADKEDILDMQLYAYVMEKPVIAGACNEFLMSPAIDNIASVYACLEGIISCSSRHHLNMIALFDNEEVGNGTKQGAASNILLNVIRKIFLSIGRTEENIIESINDGFMLSIDGAHAVHPAHFEKSDPVNEIYLNHGIVIKKAAKQSYCTDCESAAVVIGMCKDNDIPCQTFYNRSDVQGGSTLGTDASKVLSMRAADVGIPMLAMHSAVETMGVKDEEFLVKLVKSFFS